MKNKLNLAVVLLLHTFTLSPAVAHASGNLFDLDPLNGPYTVDALGSKVEKDNFQLSETPYAFIEFDQDTLNTARPLYVKWLWQSPHLGSTYIKLHKIDDLSADPVSLWSVLDNWDDVKTSGDWKLAAFWINPISSKHSGGGLGFGHYSFTVTPEPISSALFLAGGIPIGLRLYRKRKIKNI